MSLQDRDPHSYGTPVYERRKADAYFTPPWCTIALLNAYPFLPRQIWEPAAGAGNISQVLRWRSFDVHATDLHDYGNPDVESGLDFLKTDIGESAGIVTNPPFERTLVNDFVERAIRLGCHQSGGAALLLPKAWDAAKTRRHLFESPFYAAEVILLDRPQWIEGELRATPRKDYVWHVWDARSRLWPATKIYISRSDVKVDEAFFHQSEFAL